MRILLVSGIGMGWQCAKALLEKKMGLVSIFSLPESMSGRSGYKDFSELGRKYGIEVHKYEDINCNESISKIKQVAPDLILVIGWSGIIGEEILKIPKKGVIGHHPTLLPKHRGNAPIPWTLINGLAKSGVTLFYLEKEIDNGGIAGQKEFNVDFSDDASSLYSKATEATVSLLLETLPKIEKGILKPVAQDRMRASRWGKRKPEDGIMDWNSMSIYLYNWIRGLAHPYPGAFTFLGDKKLIVWKARISESKKNGKPGEVLSTGGGITVKTGDGAILVEKVQLEGGDEVEAAEFVKKHGITAGTILG